MDASILVLCANRHFTSVTVTFYRCFGSFTGFRDGQGVIGPYYCKKVGEVKSKFMQMTLSQNRHCRNQHSMAYQISHASKDAYKKRFSPQTIRDWNYLPDSLISAAELQCSRKLPTLYRTFGQTEYESLSDRQKVWGGGEGGYNKFL